MGKLQPQNSFEDSQRRLSPDGLLATGCEPMSQKPDNEWPSNIEKSFIAGYS